MCDFLIYNDVLVKYTGSCEEVEIPEGVTSIANFAFDANKYITSVRFPKSLKEIGSSFISCKNLKNIQFTDSIVRINGLAFSQCSQLKDVVLPNRLKIIEQGVFQDCIALEKVVVGDNTTTIMMQAFGGCTNLKELYIGEKTKRIAMLALHRIKAPVTLYGVKGSAAEQYAQKYNHKFIEIERSRA